ncbi:hypothetical protein KGP26_29820 (plasmid) [Serratia sp. JSRIV002]|uniref:hypothetical protein n=1 Tax=Serratia sp. JSRIV002 TaxID=2831894 RepID=UPI001CBD7CE9|nr:hypothetical protein [Serratia sp. JSRIV002]UAN54747.1 hypothetical protein KGP26_29820 [Serratia sp. JSRIV002]
MKYRLTDDLSLTTDTDRNLDIVEASNALALIAGLKHDPVASMGPANVFVSADGSRTWIRKHPTDDSAPDFSAYETMPELRPFDNLAFGQSLVRSLGLVVSPLIFKNGDLIGQWYVELNTGYGANDMAKTGLKVGTYEPVSEVSDVLNHAICFAALRIAGIGRKAYVLKPAVEGEKPTLQFMSDTTYQWMLENTDMGKDVIPVPELDEYAFTGISAEDAVAKIESILSVEKAQDQADEPEQTELATGTANAEESPKVDDGGPSNVI